MVVQNSFFLIKSYSLNQNRSDEGLEIKKIKAETQKVVQKIGNEPNIFVKISLIYCIFIFLFFSLILLIAAILLL